MKCIQNNILSNRLVYSEVARPDYFRKNSSLIGPYSKVKTGRGDTKKGGVLFSMIEIPKIHGILSAIIANTVQHLDFELCEPLGCSVNLSVAL